MEENIMDRHCEDKLKSFEDHTLAESIGIKEDVDETYGEGAFNMYIGNDIVRMPFQE